MQCVQYWLGKGVRQITPSQSSSRLVKSDSDTLDTRSMNEVAEVAERILQNLNSVFEKDDQLDEFDIVPQESQSNRSPVIHLEHKLGLESWCVGFVYSHSFCNFILLRPQKCVHVSSKDASPMKTKIDYSQLTEGEKWNKCLELTRLLILLNPDLTTAWNFRREAVTNGYTTLEQEFHLVALVCSRKPKSSETFYYRKWLVKHSLKQNGLGTEFLMEFFDREVNLAQLAASKYFSNYHAWDYRRWILDTWLSLAISGDMRSRILNAEKQASDAWLNTHISDYCGYHYRQTLVSSMMKFQLSSDDSRTLLLDELKENRGMLLFYPGHESLWYHRKFLIKQYTAALLSNSEFEDTLFHLLAEEQNLVVEGISPKSNPERMNDDLLKSCHMSDCMKLNQTYAERYLKWLQTSFLKYMVE